MENYLRSKFILVLFTNLFEVSKAVKPTFNRNSSQTEQVLTHKFSNIGVLFFDDLGTEVFSKNSGDAWALRFAF